MISYLKLFYRTYNYIRRSRSKLTSLIEIIVALAFKQINMIFIYQIIKLLFKLDNLIFSIRVSLG